MRRSTSKSMMRVIVNICMVMYVDVGRSLQCWSFATAGGKDAAFQYNTQCLEEKNFSATSAFIA